MKIVEQCYLSRGRHEKSSACVEEGWHPDELNANIAMPGMYEYKLHVGLLEIYPAFWRMGFTILVV